MLASPTGHTAIGTFEAASAGNELLPIPSGSFADAAHVAGDIVVYSGSKFAEAAASAASEIVPYSSNKLAEAVSAASGIEQYSRGKLVEAAIAAGRLAEAASAAAGRPRTFRDLSSGEDEPAVSAAGSRIAPYINTTHAEEGSVAGTGADDLPPLGSLLDRFIVVPAHRLLFCCIDKVACKSFNKLLWHAQPSVDGGPEDLLQCDGSGPGGRSACFLNSPQHHNFTTEMLQQALVNTTWHKAVFYRDPVERFLSAYRSECEQPAGAAGRGDCLAQIGGGDAADDAGGAVPSFDAVVASILAEDAAGGAGESRSSTKFRRQSEFCGGLTSTLQYYDTVEYLSRATVRAKVQTLLAQVGVDAAALPLFGELFPDATSAAGVEVTEHGFQIPNCTESWATKGLLEHFQADYDLFKLQPRESVPTCSMNVAAPDPAGRPRPGESLPDEGAWQEQPRPAEPMPDPAALRQPPVEQPFATSLSRSASDTASDLEADEDGLESGNLPTLSNDLLDRFIVVPEHRLLFCYIEKVACKNFNDLFRYVRSRYEPEQAEGEGWVASWYRNTPKSHGLTKLDLKKILVNESWHKAVFYRDPIMRFVSAYRSKCEGADEDGSRYCDAQFGREGLRFDEAVSQIGYSDIVNMSDDGWYNEHFRKQTAFCGGLAGTLKYYDTVEPLSRATATQKVSRMLDKVGIDPASVPHFRDMFPDDNTTSWEQDEHNTQTFKGIARYLNDSNAWASSVLVKHYSEDYRVFGTRPVSSILTRAAKYELHSARTSVEALNNISTLNPFELKKEAKAAVTTPSAAPTTTLLPEESRVATPILGSMMDSFIIVPRLNLLFCSMDAVASENFTRVFRTVQASSNLGHLPRIQLRDTSSIGSPSKLGFSKEAVGQLLQNRSWHKAVFYRDPIARFLSMYKKLCVKGGSPACRDMFGDAAASFSDAVRVMGEEDSRHRRHLDRIFRLETDACGGLAGTLQYYDTVEALDGTNSRYKVRKLLAALGVDALELPGFTDLFPPPPAAPRAAGEEERELASLLDDTNSWAAYILAQHFQRDYEALGLRVPAAVERFSTRFLSSAIAARGKSWSRRGSRSGSSSRSRSRSRHIRSRRAARNDASLPTQSAAGSPPTPSESISLQRVGGSGGLHADGEDLAEASPTRASELEGLLPIKETLDHLVALPERRLLFCFIDSVGAQRFRSLLSAVRADLSLRPLGHLSAAAKPAAAPAEPKLSDATLESILRNESWHKVVFHGDPILRFISAYSGCHGADAAKRDACKAIFGNGTITFSSAVQAITMSAPGELARLNGHFRRQSEFCGGLDGSLKYYDTVSVLSESTARLTVQDVMLKVGVDVDVVAAFDELFPLPSIAAMERDPYDSAAAREEVMTSYFSGDNIWAASALLEFYKSDYKIFGSERPQTVA